MGDTIPLRPHHLRRAYPEECVGDIRTCMFPSAARNTPLNVGLDFYSPIVLLIALEGLPRSARRDFRSHRRAHAAKVAT